MLRTAVILCSQLSVDLFKSPSEKIYELTTCVNASVANSKIEKGNDFSHQSSLTLGLRCARIDILSSTHVFFFGR